MSGQRYYIATTKHESLWPRGVILWWGPKNCGYSSRLEFAGKYTEAEAREIVKQRDEYPQECFMVPVESAEAAAIKVVDIDKIKELTAR